jgi:hypothetical protein
MERMNIFSLMFEIITITLLSWNIMMVVVQVV